MEFAESSQQFGPERALALTYLPASRREMVIAIWRLDLRLRELAMTAKDAMLGRIRLQWWADQMAQLDPLHPPAEPLLQALAAAMAQTTAAQDDLSELAIGWQQLVQDGEPDDAELAAYADFRGRAMFRLMTGDDQAAQPVLIDHGPTWALADVAALLPAGGLRTRTLALAARMMPLTGPVGTARAARAAGALAWLARWDVSGTHRPALARIARMAWHRLSGR